MMQTPHGSSQRAWTKLGVTALIALLVLGGFWLRTRNLGSLGLVADEGYHAHSVQGILEHGVPKVPVGRIYSRGLPFLYAEAAAASVIGVNEFSLRLPAAVFGTLAIVAAVLLAGTIFNQRVGLVVAAMMAVSVWEIEISRYARFYTGFQCMYLLALWCFFRGYLQGHRAEKVWFMVATLLAIAMHDLGVMLATCFLIPIFIDVHATRRNLLYAAGMMGTVVVWRLYDRLLGPLQAMGEPFAAEGGNEAATTGLPAWLGAITDRFLSPNLEVLQGMLQAPAVPFLVLTSLMAAGTGYLVIRARRPAERAHFLTAIPMLWAAWAYQFPLVFAMWVAHLALFARQRRDLVAPALRPVYAATAVCLTYWAATFAAHEASWTQMFGSPNFYQYFLGWLVRGWPVLLPLFAIGTGWLCWRFFTNRRDVAAAFLLGAIFLPAFLGSCLESMYDEARYTFHLYPLILIVVAALLVETGSRLILKAPTPLMAWGRSGVVAAAVLAGVCLSADLNPALAWSIGNRTHRSAKDPIRGHMNWTFYASFHQDQKSPALYVKAHMQKDDVIIALGPHHQTSVYHYYTGRVHYSVDDTPKHFLRRPHEEQRIDHVSGSVILEDVASVQRVLAEEADHGIWVLGDRQLLAAENDYYLEPLKGYLTQLTAQPGYVGLDGKSFAVKVR